jgi:phage/plasmid-like protein (TIGR03299 family)
MTNVQPLVRDRVDAMRALGTDVTGTTQAFDALADAGLAGWKVEKQQLHYPDGTLNRGVHGLRRGNGEPLHSVSVGDRYQVIQYEHNAELLDAVRKETGGEFDRAGSLHGGTRAFLSIALGDPVILGGSDPVRGYIVAFMGHGNVANRFAPTAVRVYCENQESQITRGNKHTVTIRHTTKADERMRIARRTLIESVAAFRELAEEAERMAQNQLTDKKFQDIVDRLYPKTKESGRAATEYDNRMRTMRYLFNDSPTNANITGTVWGGLQAVYEYIEHHSRVRGGDGTDPNYLRAERSLIGVSTAADRDKAYAAFTELLNVA